MTESGGLLRQWNLLAELATRPQGATVHELASEHDVNPKTISRDLATLRQAGFPLEEERGDFGRKYWKLAPSAASIPMSFAWDEAISLCLARRFLEPLAGTLFWAAASKGFAKIRAALGEQPRAYLEQMAAAFHLTMRGTPDKYAAKSMICDELTRAIEENLVCELCYQSGNATEPASRIVHPLGWVVHNSSLYLVAHAPEHDMSRVYKLDRVESVEVTRNKFVRPPGFSLDTFMTGAFGVYRGDGQEEIAVKVRFLPAVARAVGEKQYHKSQRLTPQRDGSVIAEFRLTALPELKSWLRSWGPSAVVLEPEVLREEITAELQQSLENYGAGRAKSKRKTNRKPR